jgi:hypothetical protein
MRFMLVSIAICYGPGYFYDFEANYFIVTGIFLLVFTIPSLYLHLEYYCRNRGEILQITGEHIIYTKGNFTHQYNISDIEEVILFKALNAGGVQRTPIEGYHFARIKLPDREIIITCLLIPDVGTALRKLKGVKTERVKCFFCSLRLKW